MRVATVVQYRTSTPPVEVTVLVRLNAKQVWF